MPKTEEITLYIENKPDKDGNRYGLGYWPVSGPRCVPIIMGSWQQADGRVMVWESGGKQYKCALKDTAILVCQYGGWIQVVEVAESERTGKSVLTEEQMLLIKTIYGEAANCSETSWEAVANVIMNRMGTREWTKYDTVTKVIKSSGFDAYTNPNDPYKTAEKYLNNRDGSNAKLEKLISIVLDVYNRKSEDNTNGAALYYSPKAQAALHKKFPKSYPSLVPTLFCNSLCEVY